MMPHSHAPMHGCGCPPRHCGPPVRHCRKESKELLVQPEKASGANTNLPGGAAGAGGLTGAGGVTTGRLPIGTKGEAIIGGGCCVQLSVEYMPANVSLLDQVCMVAVEVADSEGSILAWSKKFKEGYHVKECIITTYPGAKLLVLVDKAIARVRWCEIFSC